MKLTTRVRKKSQNLDATRTQLVQQLRGRRWPLTPKVSGVTVLVTAFVCGFVVQRASGYIFSAIRRRFQTLRQSAGSLRGLILGLRQQLLMIQPLLRMFT